MLAAARGRQNGGDRIRRGAWVAGDAVTRGSKCHHPKFQHSETNAPPLPLHAKGVIAWSPPCRAFLRAFSWESAFSP
jgi:hypothetical protein